MDLDPEEVARRRTIAIAAIQAASAPDHESDVHLFATHHVEEIEDAYWIDHLGTSSPTVDQVLSLLELQKTWNEDEEDDVDEEDDDDESEEGLDVFDFGLPGDVSQYVICVRFDSDGEVVDVGMES